MSRLLNISGTAYNVHWMHHHDAALAITHCSKDQSGRMDPCLCAACVDGVRKASLSHSGIKHNERDTFALLYIVQVSGGLLVANEGQIGVIAA